MNRAPIAITLLSMAFGCTQEQEEDLAPEVEPPTFDIHSSESEVTESAQEAVTLAPSWLQWDLSLSFSKLDDETQDDLAALLLNLEDPRWTDEVAFVIAHLSPELLEHNQFYPQIVVENAQFIYERDADLPYVELIEEGQAGIDDDYWTTARYQIEDEDGQRLETTLEPDVYYWYLVHPRMEDEYPFYIDGWASCSGAECASNPEDGQFWREFLWNGALEECPEDRECPVIEDYVTTEEVMWKSKSYDRSDNGAIGALINWEKDAISFGAGDERPIQPNRIYAVGCGNCGEWADMATAAARTALIPSQNVGARANDHTWNEFWDEGWMQWEPVNTYVGHWYYYQNSKGDTSSSNAVYAITSSRGDGLVETHRTVDYGNTFELTVEVLDTNGMPVDGAVVTLYGPILVYAGYEDYWWYAAEGTTGPDGLAHMTLGENNAFALRVDAAIGSNPEEADYILPFLETTTAGEDEFISVTIDAEMPALNITEVAEPIDGSRSLSFVIEMEHRLAADTYMLRGSFSKAIETGMVDRFVVNSENYERYIEGEAFEAFAVERGVGNHSGVISIPNDDTYSLVISNDQSTAMSAMGSVVTIVSSETENWTDSVGAVSTQSEWILAPGEHVAVTLAP